MPEEYAGHVIITWPPATGPAVSAWDITIHDADTGRDLGSVTTVATITIDPTKFTTADLTMLVDAIGEPIAAGAQPVFDEETQTARVGTFRYVVAASVVNRDPHAACTALTADELGHFVLREQRRAAPRSFSR